jgi:hypothetical protein
MPDTIDVLANVSNLSRDDVKRIWESVKANQMLLDSCKAPHDFQPVETSGKFVREHKCSKCGGVLEATKALWYVKGLLHGGLENPDDKA